MRNLYCTPFESVQMTEWKNLEEAFNGCDSIANCKGFMMTMNGQFGICTSFEDTRFVPFDGAVYIKESNSKVGSSSLSYVKIKHTLR